MTLRLNVKEILTLRGFYGHSTLLALIKEKCRGTPVDELSDEEICKILGLNPEDKIEFDFSCDISKIYVARLKIINKINLVLYDNGKHMERTFKGNFYAIVHGENNKLVRTKLSLYSYIYRLSHGYIYTPHGKKHHLHKNKMRTISRNALSNPKLQIFLWFILQAKKYQTRHELMDDILASSFMNGLMTVF